MASKKTMVIEARCNYVDLAIIAKAMFDNGIAIHSRSNLVGYSLRELADILIQSGRAKMVDEDRAKEILSVLGLIDTRRKGSQKSLFDLPGVPIESSSNESNMEPQADLSDISEIGKMLDEN